MVEPAAEEDRISDLFFQLSSSDRRKIVHELQKASLKLNEVAKKLDLTATEAFRQLQRLTDAGLLEKIPDGKYRSTPYANLVLESYAGTDFISRHRDYFLEHDVSLLPPEFRARFGELSNTVLQTDTVANLNQCSEMFKNAGKKIDVMVEQRLEVHGQIMRDKRMEQGVKLRYLLQESLLEGSRAVPPPPKELGETRTIPKICAMVVMTEKEMGVAFPRLDGRMDYMVFAGTDPAAMKWASDLFEDQWEIAKPWRR